jgi:hypothetical protein
MPSASAVASIATSITTHPQTPRNETGSAPERTSDAIAIVSAGAIACSASGKSAPSDSPKSARLLTPPTGWRFSSAICVRLAAISASIILGSCGRSSLQTPLSASTDRMSGF